MSKKLDSILKPSNTLGNILAKVPPATVADMSAQQAGHESLPVQEKMDKIVAKVPYSLKLEIRRYLAENLGETERSVILKGLKAIGFKVSQSEIMDKRGKKY